MLKALTYTKIEPFLNRMVGFLAQKKITPNQLTLAGLFVSLLAGWAYSGGLFFLGLLLLIAAGMGDLLDGPLARLTEKTSKFGAFLDSTVDRYSDFFLFGGIAYYFAVEESWGIFLTTLGVILGSFATSYAKARAESLIASCPVGIFERPERMLLLGIGSLIPAFLPLMLVVLLLGTHATAIQRMVYVWKTLKESGPHKK